ncbi:Ig-like domain repeat protein [Nocardioides dongkuii]|uniref:Ig-like domain repeat protein n=1 Tax=Nocardioides dongkuii TaxID=2760089 RepID=UPI0015FD61F9|nr:Ig-like domain repeat protein [Nocardioides dongkuii]
MFRSRVLTLALGLALAAGGAVPLASPPAAHAAATDAPIGLSPAGGAVADGPIALGWDRPAGATRFDVQVSASPDFATTLVSIADTVNLRYVPTVQLPDGELWWRVRSSGAEDSAWTTESFRHDERAAPTPIRPAVDAVLQPPVDTPRFAWQPVAGATAYTIQVSRDPEFTDPALITANTQRTTAAVLVNYQLAGTYYWRVNATLGTGYATTWSEPREYRVEGLLPARLTGPTDSFDAPVREVVLDWEPVPGAVTYQVQVSTDGGFLSVVHSATGVTGTRYAPPTTLANDEYYWRVRPVDASGNVAPWPASPWKFRRAWPDQPHLVHPRGDIDGSMPFFFQWDAMEMASKYTVSLFGPDGKEVCEVTTVHTTLADDGCRPGAAGDYSWVVLGRDEGGSAAPTTDVLSQKPVPFHYEPAPTPPTTPAQFSDSDMVTGHAASLTGTAAFGSDRDVCTAVIPATCVDLRQTPVLTWDPVPGALSYRVSFWRDRELTTPLAELRPVVVQEPLWTPTTTTLPDSQAGSAYFWVVQPCAKSGSGCAGLKHARHSFAKKSVAPRLVTPVDGVDVSDDVTLDWTSELQALRHPDAPVGSSLTTPASTEARSYVVETAVDPDFVSRIESVTVDQTTFTSFKETYPEGPVYWRVRAIDGGNTPTVWSETGRFVKRSAAPVPTSPADGAAMGADYTLSWEPLPFAAAYEIEVYAGPTKVAGSTSWKHASWAPSDPLPVSDAGYTWRVRRIDARGRKGEWSPVRSFHMTAIVPSTIAPAPGAVVVPSTSYFHWQPDERATSYRFERRKAGTTSLVENVATRATAWAPTAALAAGSWEWRVVALDARNASLGASPWQGFSVVDPPAVVRPVTVAGSGAVGTELRATPPIFDPTVDAITYQWYRGSTPIDGATGEVYTVVRDDLGKKVSVRATGTLAGYTPAVTSSESLDGATGAALVPVTLPSIAGRPVVGQTLEVEPGTWPEEPRLRYQWFRDGTAIRGADDEAYRLTAEDAGRGVWVVETATVTGLEPGTAESDGVTVARLASSTSLSLSASKVSAKERVTATVRVSVSGLSAPGGSVTIRDGGRKLKTLPLGSGATITFKLPRLAKGKHKITATYGGSAQAAASSRTVALKVLKAKRR